LFIERVEPMRLVDEVPRSDKGDVVHWMKRDGPSTSNSAPRAANSAAFFVDQVVALDDRACLRTGDGQLRWASRAGVSELKALGRCDAVTTTTAGKLLASFRGVGIHVLEGDTWKRLFDDPCPAGEREHWAYLAEHNGQVAYATTSVPQLDKSAGFDPKNPKWTRTGTDALWVSQADRLVPLFRDGVWGEGVIGK
jgi:hypothetical protein